MLTHGSFNHQLWMWDQQLGHTLGYLKRLLPSLKNSITTLSCETSVLAKSHKHSYFPSSTHTDCWCALMHFDVWGSALACTPRGFSYFVFLLWMIVVA